MLGGNIGTSLPMPPPHGTLDTRSRRQRATHPLIDVLSSLSSRCHFRAPSLSANSGSLLPSHHRADPFDDVFFPSHLLPLTPVLAASRDGRGESIKLSSQMQIWSARPDLHLGRQLSTLSSPIPYTSELANSRLHRSHTHWCTPLLMPPVFRCLAVDERADGSRQTTQRKSQLL